jgi:hypothetical protein
MRVRAPPASFCGEYKTYSPHEEMTTLPTNPRCVPVVQNWTWAEIESAILRIRQDHWSTAIRAGLSVEDVEFRTREAISTDLRRELTSPTKT